MAVLVLGSGPAAAQQQGRTMRLTGVAIDRSGIVVPAVWTLPPRDEASTSFSFGSARFQFPLPDTVPATGAPVTMTLSTTGSNYAPSMSIYGDAVREGRTDLGNFAQAQNGMAVTLPPESKTVNLDPRRVTGATTSASVRMLDGPVYTYTYAMVAPPVAPVPAGPTSATVTPGQAFTLPSAKRCVSRRSFKIRLKRPGSVKHIAAKVSVNGRQVPVVVAKERYKTIRGKVLQRRRLTAQVDLRGLAKGRFRVAITAVTGTLRTIRGQRRYRTCAGKGPNGNSNL